MIAAFTAQESSALFHLLTSNATDIVLKTDRVGFVVHAMPSVVQAGRLLPGEWVGRHLLDIVEPSHSTEIAARHRAAMTGRSDDSWTEFPAWTAQGEERWFEVRMGPLAGAGEAPYGVLAVMRSIEERKQFERRLFAASMTDQLTGLSNRTAFIAMLRHLLDRGAESGAESGGETGCETGCETGGETGRPGDGTGAAGCLAIFDIDHFKAINLRYGQSVGDDVLVAFADFIRMMLRSQDIISRIGGESIGVLLPGAQPGQAEAICRRIVASIADIGGAGGSAIPITASAGAARIAGSVDDTLNHAEVALALAKAKGRNRLEMDAGSMVRAALG